MVGGVRFVSGEPVPNPQNNSPGGATLPASSRRTIGRNCPDSATGRRRSRIGSAVTPDSLWIRGAFPVVKAIIIARGSGGLKCQNWAGSMVLAFDSDLRMSHPSHPKATRARRIPDGLCLPSPSNEPAHVKFCVLSRACRSVSEISPSAGHPRQTGRSSLRKTSDSDRQSESTLTEEFMHARQPEEFTGAHGTPAGHTPAVAVPSDAPTRAFALRALRHGRPLRINSPAKRPSGPMLGTRDERPLLQATGPASPAVLDKFHDFVVAHGQYFDSYLATEPGRLRFW